MIRSAVRTTLRSLLDSYWCLDRTRQLIMCIVPIQWWQSIKFSAAPVAGWTSSAGEGSTASAGPFLQWSLCDSPTSGPGRWCCPGIWINEWCIYIVLYCVLLYTQSALQSGGVSPQPPPVVTPLQSQCCSWWWVGESRGVSLLNFFYLHSILFNGSCYSYRCLKIWQICSQSVFPA